VRALRRLTYKADGFHRIGQFRQRMKATRRVKVDRIIDTSQEVTRVSYGLDRLNGCWCLYRHWQQGNSANMSVVTVSDAELERIRKRAERQREAMIRIRKQMRGVRKQARRDYERRTGGRPQ